MTNLLNPSENHYISYDELHEDTSTPITIAPFSSYLCRITPTNEQEVDASAGKLAPGGKVLGAKDLLLYDSIQRFVQFLANPAVNRQFLKKNPLYHFLVKGLVSYQEFKEVLERLAGPLRDAMTTGVLAASLQRILYWIAREGDFKLYEEDGVRTILEQSSSQQANDKRREVPQDEIELLILAWLTHLSTVDKGLVPAPPTLPSSSSSNSVANIGLPLKNSGSSSNLAGLRTLSSSQISNSSPVGQLSEAILRANKIGPIVFICPELGQWSTVGGLGVMVDELTQDLAVMGCDVHVISPYYNRNRKGATGYLAQDGIRWVHNLHTWVGSERVEVGVHEGRVNGIHLLFLHHLDYFPHVYPSGSPDYNLKTIVLMAKASLEAICSIKTIPAIIITNDWFTALVPAYAKSGAFGSVFQGTSFLHLIHNLGEGYQGWIYPERPDLTYNEIHHLDNDLLFDPLWSSRILNPSRCALLASDTWATVSKSYRDDLLASSSQSPLLRKHSHPFATSNGIRKQMRLQRLSTIAKDHDEAKERLQAKYFGRRDVRIPVFSFVGRITSQKGVHLICETAEELIRYHKGQVQIIVGGPADPKDLYAADCASSIRYLKHKYPQNFWGEPDAFFTDGPLVNYGSDFGLMPSLFEPGGVVQHEFFVAGTPVIAFKTGGLKDTVFEWQSQSETGNGFTFEAHHRGDFMWAFNRAVACFHAQPTNYRRTTPLPPYYKLRENASNSVIDTTDVAYAWFSEFSRLRKRVCAPKSKIDSICVTLQNETQNNQPSTQQV
eukprot:TRINITY_DN1920_c0_g2_i2.p1 TRINITY_DN1920_c0_g2~~TRINITY_DN1920_c0_g2_i2.p1  ORF type:complete len:779 (-),score=196.83 TRINITY_DN1920_c0_g2_i2:145-2481(-)